MIHFFLSNVYYRFVPQEAYLIDTKRFNINTLGKYNVDCTYEVSLIIHSIFVFFISFKLFPRSHFFLGISKMSFKELDIKPHKKHIDDEKTPRKNGTTVH